MREILEGEVELVKDKALYSWFNGKVTLVDLSAFDDTAIDNLSADCVHLNIEGQRLIGDIVWEQIESDFGRKGYFMIGIMAAMVEELGVLLKGK